MTYASAIAALSALTVTGVRKSVAYMPDRISTADFPLMFPVLPRGTATVATLTGAKSLQAMTVTLWVLVEAATQNLPLARFDAVVAILDGLVAALNAQTMVDGYALRMELIQIEATNYWSVVAEVEVS